MNSHPLIPDHELPKCLLGPLIIGNLEQIKALKSINKKIEDRLARNAKIESGELKSFDVTAEIEGYHTITVYTENATQAEEEALERISADDFDIDISVDSVRRIKPKGKT